jgi:hypothetical protein
MLVFIDESGDPGFKVSKGSSPLFVVSLVAFKKTENALLAQEAIAGLASFHKLSTEFKFSQSRDEIRDGFFQALKPIDFCVRAIVIQKEKVYSPHLRTDKEAFYAYFVKTMLKFDNGLLQNAKVVIDGSGDQTFKRELSRYLKRHTGPGAIRDVRFSNSKNDRLVQMADMCTGAIARSYRTDRADARRWKDMLADKIEDIWDFK